MLAKRWYFSTWLSNLSYLMVIDAIIYIPNDHVKFLHSIPHENKGTL